MVQPLLLRGLKLSFPCCYLLRHTLLPYLFAGFAGRVACFRIDEMHRASRKAGDAMIDIAGRFGLVVVWSEALRAEACGGQR